VWPYTSPQSPQDKGEEDRGSVQGSQTVRDRKHKLCCNLDRKHLKGAITLRGTEKIHWLRMSSTSLGAKLESAMNTDVALESYSVTEDEMIRLNQQYMLYVLDFG
jgi:hypothetical protein